MKKVFFAVLIVLFISSLSIAGDGKSFSVRKGNGDKVMFVKFVDPDKKNPDGYLEVTTKK